MKILKEMVHICAKQIKLGYLRHMNNCFHKFGEEVLEIALPLKFTFPFYYEPHPLTLIAAKRLQQYLLTQNDWIHNFGLDPSQEGSIIGKMFGVMVVRNQENELGFISAFSGKISDSNHLDGFVPPIFDILDPKGFYKIEEKEIDKLTKQISDLESNLLFIKFEEELRLGIENQQNEIQILKKEFNLARKQRKKIRTEAKLSNSIQDYEILHNEHRAISYEQQHHLKRREKHWQDFLFHAKKRVDQFAIPILQLKEERKNKSNTLQHQVFDQYHFLNQLGETESVLDIFSRTTQTVPPAGAGECAAPKLLQYAFIHQLEPICLGEFWWGTPPKSEVRKHGNFYPACRGKCEPILAHMLKGLDMDINPIIQGPSHGLKIEIIFEDETFVIINKPHEFLSVPGKSISDSVYLRMRQLYPEAGPLIVHRLDMSTSGLMIIAKSKTAHKELQKQFIKRKVIKRYSALLDGILKSTEGEISLPLRVDLNDRPRQLVCYDHGKHAHTNWKVIEVMDGKTKIHFYPITGRTHQLRVHAAHKEGLGIPILGDDLYGRKADRLHLHAAYLSFLHPITKERIEFFCDETF